MQAAQIEWRELQRLARSAGADAPPADAGALPVLLVDLDATEPDQTGPVTRSAGAPHGVHAVVVGISSDPGLHPGLCDLVLPPADEELELLVATASRHPIATMTLVELLRCAPQMGLDAGLLAESASYGVLQAGHEFAVWRSQHARRPATAVPDPVLARRSEGELRITLHRPARRNALDVAMRDALAEQLHLAIVDPSITRIVLDGAGPDFCSGGDLDEFGTADDVSLAHLVRLERSLARMLAILSDRTVVRVHGACIGSGVELAAFAGTVQAAAESSFGLPELGMGLVPGAGGTVSLPRRIGRHRTCRLALTGVRLDATTALDWGLVDVVEGSTPTK